VTNLSDDARPREDFSVLDECEQKVLSSMAAIWPRQDTVENRGFAPRTQASFGSDDGIPLPMTMGGEVSVIARRRSSRDLATLITLAAFSAIVDRLYLGARLRIPSTGGIGALSMLFVVNRVSGIDPGAYTLSSSGRRLMRQDNSPAIAHLVNAEFRTRLSLAEGAEPAVCILIFADTDAVARRYTAGALSSSLLDCGILMQTVQLAATETGLNSCIVGCALNAHLQGMVPVDTEVVANLGGVALGG
jgi:SagB-type dehydrogenase family enzyme